MQNIRFIYLYRDGGNYKSWGKVVFSNPANVTPSVLTIELQRAFMTDGLFIAHQIRLPEVLFYSDLDLTIHDHCFHEFDSVEVTLDVPNDPFARSISEFLAEIVREAAAGWRAFDPYEHVLEARRSDSMHGERVRTVSSCRAPDLPTRHH